MVSHCDLAKEFVGGKTKGTASRMFIKDDAIYSYGEHFPIAYRLGVKVFLFNMDKYSSSTSKHQRYVIQALNDCSVIETDTSTILKAIAYEHFNIALFENHHDIESCFDNLKVIFAEKGIQRVPVKKWLQMVTDWELTRAI